MSADTVLGQGTNPKPQDETYLNLLKKTVASKKIKVKIDEAERKTKKEEEEEEMTKHKTTIDYKIRGGSDYNGASPAADFKEMN